MSTINSIRLNPSINTNAAILSQVLVLAYHLDGKTMYNTVSANGLCRSHRKFFTAAWKTTPLRILKTSDIWIRLEIENYALDILSLNKLVSEQTAIYHTNAKEADDRIWRHASQSWVTRILIYSPDTDAYYIDVGYYTITTNNT